MNDVHRFFEVILPSTLSPPRCQVGAQTSITTEQLLKYYVDTGMENKRTIIISFLSLRRSEKEFRLSYQTHYLLIKPQSKCVVTCVLDSTDRPLVHVLCCWIKNNLKNDFDEQFNEIARKVAFFERK